MAARAEAAFAELLRAAVLEGVPPGTRVQPYPETVRRRYALAHGRLDEVFAAAAAVPFDDSSRIVFFSDCHRGDGSRADAFSRNEDLFLRALAHYRRAGFTYVEVGDGDELWKNRSFGDVRRAHGRTFDLFHALAREGRLHLVLGNHDLQNGQRGWVEKDGLVAREGLILRHARTGQRLFVVHGHQADFVSDQLRHVGRVLVRHVWRRVQLLGVGTGARRERVGRELVEWVQGQVGRVERRIVDWARARGQAVICGHTHRPRCAPGGAAPYFNAGSCVGPGTITGLELQGGEIALVRWSARPGTAGAVRELLAAPRRLALFDRW